MAPSQTTSTRSICAVRLIGVGLILAAGFCTSGCSAIRGQSSQRREACDSFCQRARNAKREGWGDQADLLLNEAVRQRPDDLETRRLLVEAMWECGRQQDAIDECRDLAKTHPRDARLHQRLAVMSWTTGQRANAAQSAERALQLNPTCADALLVKARCQTARRDFEGAVSTYIRLTRCAPDLLDAKLELAEVHVERGNCNQACSILRDVLATTRLSAEQKADAEWKLGLAYASADRWTEAATHLAGAIEKRESESSDWQLVMIARCLAGQDSGGFESSGLLASASHNGVGQESAWTILRDRMLVRGQILAASGTVPPNRGIRDDLSKSALLQPGTAIQ